MPGEKGENHERVVSMFVLWLQGGERMSEHIIERTSRKDGYTWYTETVEHEEIVRCRDCKHHEYLNVSYSDKLYSVCLSEQWIGAEGDNPLVEPNGFCKWGERK